MCYIRRNVTGNRFLGNRGQNEHKHIGSKTLPHGSQRIRHTISHKNNCAIYAATVQEIGFAAIEGKMKNRETAIKLNNYHETRPKTVPHDSQRICHTISHKNNCAIYAAALHEIGFAAIDKKRI